MHTLYVYQAVRRFDVVIVVEKKKDRINVVILGNEVYVRDNKG